jgi:hypothetical protein
MAVGPAQDAAVLQRIGGLEAHDRQPRPLAPQREEVLQVLGGEQRAVAVDHQHVALEVGQGVGGAEHGMAGAQRRILQHRRAQAQPSLHDFAHAGLIADDDVDPFAACRLDGVNHPVQQAAPAHLVEHLGDRGLHARAVAGGHDHGGA